MVVMAGAFSLGLSRTAVEIGAASMQVAREKQLAMEPQLRFRRQRIVVSLSNKIETAHAEQVCQ